MKQITFILSMAIAVLSFSGLNAQETKSKTTIKKDMSEMVYKCPMKCEGYKSYKKAGDCPKCGMHLKKENKESAEMVYKCPMKCEGEKTYDKAGQCPKCGMHLKAEKKEVKAVAYQCPMKCEGSKTYAKEGACPVCKMNLKKVEEKKEAKTGHEGHNHK